jgi:hypothetical protein
MDGQGTLGSSASLPLSTLSSPYGQEHAMPILETLQEDSPRVEDKGLLIMHNNLCIVDFIVWLLNIFFLLCKSFSHFILQLLLMHRSA